jgi:hypothetical protein
VAMVNRAMGREKNETIESIGRKDL